MINQNRQVPFTEAALAGLQPTDRTVEYSDTETTGFRYTITRHDKRVFQYRYIFQGNKRTLKIGDHPSISLAQARLKASQMAEGLKKGIDPQAERDAEKNMPTFREYSMGVYLPIAKQNKRSWQDDASKLRVYMLEKLGDLPVNSIKVTDIQGYLACLSQEHHLAPATVNRHRALLSKIFNIAKDHDLLASNPCERVQKLVENNQCERYLTPDEIARLVRTIKRAMNERRVNHSALAAFLMLLFTGARKREVLDMEWVDINFTTQQWHLKKNKGNRARYIPLSSEAINVLQHMRHVACGEYVFPNAQTGKPLCDPRKTFRWLLDALGIDQLRIHDLRHTFASQAVNNGASLYLVQQLLGHRSPVTTQRYAHLQSETLLNASEKIAESMLGKSIPKAS